MGVGDRTGVARTGRVAIAGVEYGVMTRWGMTGVTRRGVGRRGLPIGSSGGYADAGGRVAGLPIAGVVVGTDRGVPGLGQTAPGGDQGSAGIGSCAR